MIRYQVKKLLVLALCLFFVTSIWAGGGHPLLDIAPVTANSNLITMPLGGSVIVDYRVTNLFVKRAYVLMTAPGITQLAAGPGGCEPNFILERSASCVLRLQVNGIRAGVTEGGPVVCLGSSYAYCMKPAEGGALRIEAIPPGDAKLLSIEITPPQPTLPKGVVAQWSATALYSDNTTRDISSMVTWSSSSPNVASVSQAGLVTALTEGTTCITASYGAMIFTTTVQVTSATLASIEITPFISSLSKGAEEQFKATGIYSDSSTSDLTATVTWSSSVSSVGDISNDVASKGMFTAIATGTTSLSASYNGISSASLDLDVTSATLVSIAVTPVNPDIPIGVTQQLTATGIYTDGSKDDMTSQVTWVSSAIDVASISNGTGTAGLATGLTEGATSVSASYQQLSSNSVVLNINDATLTSIHVSATSQSVAKGVHQQFSAVGYYSDQTHHDITALVTWATTSPSVATISNVSGSAGLAVAYAAGNTNISATWGAVVSNTMPFTVTAAVLTQIQVEPVTVSIAKGTQQQFIATGIYSDGSSQDITRAATWYSQVSSFASISNASGSNGLATAVREGTTSVWAVLHSVSSSPVALTITSATLTTLQIQPLTATIPKGLSQHYTAMGIYSDGSTQDLTSSVTWSSGTLSTAVISNAQSSSGNAVSVGEGLSAITALYHGHASNQAVLTVTAPALVSIAITSPDGTIAAGMSEQFVATGTYTDDSQVDITARVVWSSSLGTIDSVGLLSTTTAGTATVTAALDSLSSSKSLAITAPVLASLVVSYPDESVAAGLNVQFTATGIYTDQSQVDLTHSVTWESFCTYVADIGVASGLAETHAIGISFITASLNGISGTTTLLVGPPHLASLNISVAPSMIAAGNAQQLIATALYTDNTTQIMTTNVSWISSDASIASVSSTGELITYKPGTVSVIATLFGISSQSLPVTVGSAQLASIVITPPVVSLAMGTTSELNATGIYTDNSRQNMSSMVSWSSSDSNLATVSGTGLVTSIQAGSVTVNATMNGVISNNVALTLTPASLSSIEITPPTESMANGTSYQYSATGIYTDSTRKDITSTVNWMSSNTLVATVLNSAGMVSTLSQGSTNITATAGGIVSAPSSLTVTPATLVSIAITPNRLSLANGTETQMMAIGTYTDSTTKNLSSQVTWTSSNTTVAQVSSMGYLSTLAEGTSTISAAMNGVSSPLIFVTVTPAALVSIAVTPSVSSLALGTTEQFSAIGIYTDNSTQDISMQVTWMSDNANVAIVSNQSGSMGFLTSVSEGQTNVSANLGGIVSNSAPVNITPATLSAIQVTPSILSLAAGTGAQFIATGIYSDGSKQDLTKTVTWSSSTGAVATISNAISNAGYVMSRSLGNTLLSATFGGVISNSVSLTVTPAVLSSLAITPVNASVPLGLTQQLTATGIYTDGTTQDVTSSVTWQSSATAIATVSNAPATAGLVSSNAIGSTNMSALLNGMTSSPVNLTVTAAALSSIHISPSVLLSQPLGITHQFEAIGFYTDGTTADITSAVTWISSNPSCASISNAAASYGVLTPVTQGITTVSALYSTLSSAPVSVSVTPATLVSIEITPSVLSLASGDEEQLTATGIYSDSSTKNLTSSVTWMSSSPTLASVSNAMGSEGLLTTLAVGNATVSCILNGMSSNIVGVVVTSAVLESLEITPTQPSIAAGTTQQFTAMGVYTDGSLHDMSNAVTWSSDTPSVAAIYNTSINNGLVSSLTQGTAMISASWGSISAAPVTLTVTPATLESISVTPANPSIAAGTSQQFMATGIYTDGSTQDLTGAVTWSSDNTNVCSISNTVGHSGLATTYMQDIANISASLNGVSSGNVTLTITPATLTSLSISISSTFLPAGTSEQLTATGTFTDNSTQDLTSEVIWTSSSTSNATVSNVLSSKGLMTALAQGSTTVSANYREVFSNSLSINVTSAVLQSIAISSPVATIANGTTTQLIAIGTYSDGSTTNVTSVVTWASSAPANAAVSNASSSQGLVTAKSVGNAQITASQSGISSNSISFSVTAATLSSIALTPDSLSLIAGQIQQFSAIGTYSDGSTQTLTSVVTWVSSNTTSAAISNASGSSGLLTSVSAGSTSISASLGGVTSSSVNLMVSPAVLASITITPASATIELGSTQQYSAVGTYTNNTTQSLTSFVSWTSSNTGILTVSNSGLATPVSLGSAKISAAYQGIQSNISTLTVVPQIPVGPVLFVANYGNNTVSSCRASSTGALGACTVSRALNSNGASTLSGPTAVSINHSNTILYVTNLFSNTISYCQLNSVGAIGACIATSGNNASGVTTLNGIYGRVAFNAAGTYAYIANYNNNTVSICSVTGSGGLSNCTTSTGNNANGTTTFIGPNQADVNPAGTILYVSNFNNNTVSICPINSNGSLGVCAVSTANYYYPLALEFNKLENKAYISNYGNSTVSICTVETNGNLTNCTASRGNSTFNFSQTNGEMSFSIAGSSLYVPNGNSLGNTISICSMTSTSVALGTCNISNGNGTFSHPMGVFATQF